MTRLLNSPILQRCFANIQIKLKTNCFAVNTKTHDRMGFWIIKIKCDESSINFNVKKTYTFVLSLFLLGTLQTKLEYQNMEATIKSSIPLR